MLSMVWSAHTHTFCWTNLIAVWLCSILYCTSAAGETFNINITSYWDFETWNFTTTDRPTWVRADYFDLIRFSYLQGGLQQRISWDWEKAKFLCLIGTKQLSDNRECDEMRTGCWVASDDESEHFSCWPNWTIPAAAAPPHYSCLLWTTSFH